MRALPVLALGFMLGTVIYTRYTLSTMTRTPHNGQLMDMHKELGKHWFRHVVRPAQVGGAYYVMEEFVRADEKDGFYDGKPGSPPKHIHPHQSEEFTVLKGEFAFELNGTVYTLNEGQSATIPPGWEHYFWNHNPEKDLHFSVKLIPGLKSDGFFEAFAGIMRDSEAAVQDKEGGRSQAASPLQILALLYEYDVIHAEIPALIREPFLKLLHTIAPWFGYKYMYDEYSLPIPEGSAAAGEVSSEPATTVGGQDVHDEM